MVLPTFVSNKSFSQLPNISPANHIYTKIFYSEFLHIEVWFTDQNSKPLEIGNRTNLILVFNDMYIMRCTIEPRDRTLCQGPWIVIRCKKY